MPLKPNAVERAIFLDANLGPGPLVDLLGGLAFKAIAAAVELELFEALEAGPASLAELSRRTGASERGLRFLLGALEPLGYVELGGGRYRNSPMTRRWMLSTSATPLRDLVPAFEDMVSRWGELATAVRAGAPETPFPVWARDRPTAWPRYHGGMKAIAGLLSDEVVARTRLPRGARRLLDLGGGHGLHACRFCRRHRRLKATVLDLPEARTAAEATIAAEGMAGRVSFAAADFTTGELGEGWDVVLLFHVARGLPEEPLRELLGRIARALSPGGALVVLDQIAPPARSAFARANARLIELELFSSSPGDVHRAEALSRWIVGAGLSDPEQVRLRRAGGQALLLARRPRS